MRIVGFSSPGQVVDYFSNLALSATVTLKCSAPNIHPKLASFPADARKWRAFLNADRPRVYISSGLALTYRSLLCTVLI